ncbi:enoyl-CoA hydratase/isomerase family protein [Novosphingobium piscinae]|uniref:Enoyl-CoA hydratase/isomerase family protein n=1 Tax=Novosphingobium piscinae TaxID=1507448 RepID=A0A7X1G037_9SPHN|nr:enoyl-CoA hydratase-related protein [Novosphingobium piscinae]MBC2670111.1 enoyl-CoA hydratase/isomerase family protein [Novosphingobium piscinae]
MSLRLERAGPVARILIDRAGRRNAFTLAMWQALPRLVNEAEADPAVRVIVLAAAEGGPFSAGADIAEMLAHRADRDWLAANQAAINHAQWTLTRAKRPTLAFLDGDCIGGGCAIALACDLRLATARARIGITPARLGLVYPLHDTKLLVDLVGPAQAKRLLFTGRLFDAAEALRIGLVDELGESPEDLIGAIAGNAPSSLLALKSFVRRVLDGQTEDDPHTLRIFADAFAGPDFAEGAAAFLDKRPPRFG